MGDHDSCDGVSFVCVMVVTIYWDQKGDTRCVSVPVKSTRVGPDGILLFDKGMMNE